MGFESRRVQHFYILQNCPDCSCNPPSLLFSDYRSSLPGLKRPGCDVDHTLPSRAEVKNEWSYTFALPVYRHVGSRDNRALANPYSATGSDIILVVR